MVGLVGGGIVINGAYLSSFRIDNFSKLFLVSVSEFCHQIDETELFARPDTLS